MELTDDVIFAFVAQSVCKDLLESFFLRLKGYRGRTAKAGVDPFAVQLFRIFRN